MHQTLSSRRVKKKSKKKFVFLGGNPNYIFFSGTFAGELLSLAALEHKGSFAALASPTLNKQETVTFLYRDVVNYINGRGEKITKHNPIRLRLNFIVRLGLMFLKLVKTSLWFRINSIPEKCLYVRTWLVPRSLQEGGVFEARFAHEPLELCRSGFHGLFCRAYAC